jgi:hypothetical protein
MYIGRVNKKKAHDKINTGTAMRSMSTRLVISSPQTLASTTRFTQQAKDAVCHHKETTSTAVTMLGSVK